MNDLTVRRMFDAALAQHADRVAVRSGEQSRSYAEHFARVAALRRQLADAGVAPAERIAVLAASSLSYIEIWHAALSGSAVIVPLNIRSSEEELAYILADSRPALLFADDSCVELVAQLRATGALAMPVVWLADGGPDSDTTYEEFLERGWRSSAGLSHEPTFDDDAVIMYTGGTTGNPKGVVLSHRAVSLNTMQLLGIFQMGSASVYLAFMPMFHIGGSPQFILPFCVGASVVVCARFEPGAVLDLCRRFAPTHLGGVPTMLEMILAAPSFRRETVASLRLVCFGGAPMPLPLIQNLLAAMPSAEFNQFYGMTEAFSVITRLSGEDHRDGSRLGSAGQPLPGVEMAIADIDTGQWLPPGRTGEICIRYPGLMTHYLNKPEATARAMRSDWYHSGDVGYFDDSGYLFVVDRLADMIVSGGENIYTIEVERVVQRHPLVAQAAVVGVFDEMWGEAVHAVVVPVEDAAAALSEDDVLAFVRGVLPAYKVPKAVTFVDHLPATAVGKTRKNRLKEMVAEGVLTAEHAAPAAGG